MKLKWVIVIVAAIVLFVGGTMTVVSSIFDSAVMSVKRGHYEAAKPKLEWLAMLGDARAQNLLGAMYAYGWGVTRDREEAIRWFRRAAYCFEGVKDPAACEAYGVGENFSEGSGVKQDLVEAAWWLQFAKDGGYSGDPQGETAEQL